MSTERLVWTGLNVEEMEVFATAGDFGFVVGSSFHSGRWWHQAWNWLWLRSPLSWRWEWVPPTDISVLEIYPSSMLRESIRESGEEPYWTTARPGDIIDSRGRVDRRWVSA